MDTWIQSSLEKKHEFREEERRKKKSYFVLVFVSPLMNTCTKEEWQACKAQNTFCTIHWGLIIGKIYSSCVLRFGSKRRDVFGYIISNKKTWFLDRFSRKRGRNGMSCVSFCHFLYLPTFKTLLLSVKSNANRSWKLTLHLLLWYCSCTPFQY